MFINEHSYFINNIINPFWVRITFCNTLITKMIDIISKYL